MGSLLHRWVTWSAGVRCPLQEDKVASGSHKKGHRAARCSQRFSPSQGGSAPPILREARPRPFPGRLGPAPSQGGLAPRFLGCERARLWAPLQCEASLPGDSGAGGTFVESRLLLCLNLLPGGHKANVSRGVQGGCLLGVSLALLVVCLGLGRKDEKMDGWPVLE